MQSQICERFYVGRHVEGFVEAEWGGRVFCLIASVEGNVPWEYGITTIRKGKNFYLTPQSVRSQPARILLANHTLGDTEIVQEVNFSLLSSDDESLFITQTVSSCNYHIVTARCSSSLLPSTVNTSLCLPSIPPLLTSKLIIS